MAVTWTSDQKKVIDTRNTDILVSAAAGSGKTAVLVERIISMVCGDIDAEEPVDVDQLLVVTFTRAAAAQMKERIGISLEDRLSRDPENVHLQRQQTLIHNAQISTIDSFCQQVVRTYFHRADIDPSFRIGDDGELKLLKNEVMGELLEDHYASEDEAGRERFTRLVETYAPGRSDTAIEELVLKLYEFAVSYPDPGKWLDSCAAAYRINDEGELAESGWMRCLISYAGMVTADLKAGVGRMIEICAEPDGPYMYQDALLDDLSMLEKMSDLRDYDGMRDALLKISYTKLSGKKDAAVDAFKREEVKLFRDGMKKSLKDLKDKYFALPIGEVAGLIESAAPVTEELVMLSGEFLKRYGEKKKEKNIADFQDVEHMALEILVDEVNIRPDGSVEVKPSAAAAELSSRYTQIMTDEYQDSNLIQETVLQSVAYGQGIQNIFMVGDVKQSIYSFRKARPSLFMEKYERYKGGDGKDGALITLSRNFRSRADVTDGVNYVFRKLMTRAVGGVEYGPDEELYPGSAYPEDPRRVFTPEFIILEKDAAEGIPDQDLTARELEAKAAAVRIKRLMKECAVTDGQRSRPVRYGDIVILLRSLSGYGDVYARILNSEGIPAHTESRTGYFDAPEVRTMLDLLRIVDNPRQDIPLAAVLKSPVGGFSDKELADVKSAFRELSFHEACMSYASMPEGTGGEAGRPAVDVAAFGYEAPHKDMDAALAAKLSGFYERLSVYRRKAMYMNIHELIEYLLEDTGYADYLAASPGGIQRTANIRMLVQKAISYEKTSYRGLFNFVRYIEKLQSYDEDFGEAGIYGENEDAVRIMTIHKSKGLEFPVVIVGGLGKSFNRRDIRDRVVMHPELGIGTDYVDLESRIRRDTLPKQVLKKASDLDMLGEELRILYVAMTRAKEKLILLGTTDKLDQKMKKYYVEAGNKRLGYRTISGASTYLDWLIPAVAVQEDSPFEFSTATFPQEAADEVMRRLDLDGMADSFKSVGTGLKYDAELKAALEGSLSYEYPWKDDEELPAKFSVSELKRMQGSSPADDGGTAVFEQSSPVPYVPAFLKEEGSRTVSGAERGTAYHRVMQFAAMEKIGSMDAAKKEIGRLVSSGLLTKEQAEMVRSWDIFTFAKSNLARRMERARKRGRFRAEQPFVISVPASEAVSGSRSMEPVLIQGIIDAYFYESEENGKSKIVLADYKTDFVHEASELVSRYKIQLDYYAQALERLTGCEVKEKVIYSFCLGTEIRL